MLPSNTPVPRGPKLLDQVRDRIRFKHYSILIETFTCWKRSARKAGRAHVIQTKSPPEHSARLPDPRMPGRPRRWCRCGSPCGRGRVCRPCRGPASSRRVGKGRKAVPTQIHESRPITRPIAFLSTWARFALPTLRLANVQVEGRRFSAVLWAPNAGTKLNAALPMQRS